MAIGRINATLSGVQPGGLAKIVPTSVAVGSGSGSVNANGTVSFSGATSVSLNGVFSSAYNNYKIVGTFDSFAGSADVFNMRLRVSGSDNTSTNYRFAGNDWYTSWNAWSNTNYSNTAFTVHRYTRANGVHIAMDILNPFATNYTTWLSMSNQVGTDPSLNSVGGGFIATTSFDGFTFYPATSQNMAGTISVYGYTQ